MKILLMVLIVLTALFFGSCATLGSFILIGLVLSGDFSALAWLLLPAGGFLITYLCVLLLRRIRGTD